MRPEVGDRCCRDLKTYLESALAVARGGVVSVKLNRVLAVSGLYAWKRQYAWCLSRLLHRYKLKTGLYVLTRQQAEEVLNSIDALCTELHKAKRREKKEEKKEELEQVDFEQEEPAPVRVNEFSDGEGMPMVSFHLPRALLQALDEYARRMNVTRSDVIRMAIRQMLDKMRAAEEKEEPEYIIVV
jgi:hypothetical protein